MSTPETVGETAGRATTTLLDHLLCEHGRSPREVRDLPLAALHRFEHLEQELGLSELSHRHEAAPVTG